METTVKGITCYLEVAPKAPFNAIVTVTNASAGGVHLLKVYVPIDGFMPSELFDVLQGEARVRYKGPQAKLPGRPKQEDYLILKPGGRMTFSIPLQANYELTHPGQYSAQYAMSHPQPSGGYLRLVSNKATFEVK